MELTLSRQKINYCREIMKKTIPQEETMDAIVPDACPDILRIAATGGQLMLRSKETQNGKLIISGTIRAEVVFIPERGDATSRIEVTIPYTTVVENPQITSDSIAVVDARLKSIDARMINPRKVIVRANMLISVAVYEKDTVEVCGAADGGEEYNMEMLKSSCKAYLPVCVREKTFNVSDELDISGSKPEAAQIYKSRISLAANEMKIVGNKAVFKGVASIGILYLSGEGNLQALDYHLPFSQLVEIDAGGEGADCDVVLALTGSEMNINKQQGGGGRSISISLAMVAQVVVMEESKIDFISDLYSTSHRTNAQLKAFAFPSLIEKHSFRQTCREQLEAENVASVTDIDILVGEIRTRQEDGMTEMIADVLATVLYISTDGDIGSASRNITVTARMDVGGDHQWNVGAVCPGEIFGSAVSGGIEIRFPMDFTVMVQSANKIQGICGVNMEEREKDNSPRPSVTLKVISGKEGLWELAKLYNTTMNEIASANMLGDSDTLENGRMLIIPMKR